MKLTKEYIYEQIQKMPGIELINFKEEKKHIEFILSICCTSQINDAKFLLNYKIAVLIPNDYPLTLPKCYEYGEKKIISYHHLFSDSNNSFCLGTEMDLRLRLIPDYSLSIYFAMILDFLTIYEYFTRYGIMPLVERSHGDIGILESYRNIFSVHNLTVIVGLLALIPVKNKDKNLKCPCGSNKKFKYCHYNILKKLSASRLLFEQSKKDLELLMKVRGQI